MKRLIVTLLIAAAVAGCAPLDMSVFVEGARFLDESCEPSGETNLAAGLLDVGPFIAANQQLRYFGHFIMRSELQPLDTVSGGSVLAGTARNEFVATQVNLSYQTTGGWAGGGANEPIYFVVPPASTDSSILFNMISPDPAVETGIKGAIGAGLQDTLVVTFFFEGNIRSSSNAILPMRTPPVSFPIRLFNRAVPTCPVGSPTIKGPCGNAQDDFIYECP